MMLTTFVANYSLIIAIAKIRFFLKLVKKYLVCASRIRQKVGWKGVPLAYNYKRIEREEERSGERRGHQGMSVRVWLRRVSRMPLDSGWRARYWCATSPMVWRRFSSLMWMVP